MDDQFTSNIQDDGDARKALAILRQKRDQLSRDYAAGQLNAAQFNAMYRHYMEKSAIIEKILESNPESEVWRNVAAQGATAFLRERFEARPIYMVVFRRGERSPLLATGKLPQKAARQVHRLLTVIWQSNAWRTGLARKSLGDGMWLLLTIGENALTITVFFMQPSVLQVNKVRDLHADFERANRMALIRNVPAGRMVFPQRALFE